MTGLDDFDAAMGRAANAPRLLAGAADPETDTDQSRLAANFAAVEAEIDAPAPSRLARLLRRFGVSDAVLPLITATPSLRRSWFMAIGLALLFALSAANNAMVDDEVEQIVMFLTLAPLVPLGGVALAFGPAVDPTHAVSVAAPIDGFRLFVIRATTVLVASTAILAMASLLMPAGGLHRLAWILPGLAASTLTMAATTRFDARWSAATIAAGWVLGVTIAVSATSAATTFGFALQLGATAVALLAVAFLIHSRNRLDADHARP